MKSITVMAGLACLLVGATTTGCSGSDPTDMLTAQQMLDDANDTMSGLKSVTIEGVTTKAKNKGGDISSRLTTDLDSRCTSKVTWEAKGAVLEQIRVGETDYVRPNREYIEGWSGKAMDGAQDTWIKTAASNAQPGDGLSDCSRDFTSFGTAKKGESTEVDGTSAIRLVVTDEEDKGGAFIFYVATEGKPYILKVVYEGTEYSTTTTYSAFDEPVNVQAPAETNVLDSALIDR
ncbi:hypothetical protein PV396_21130 [Streptomyces sp. ME02-8801-2C]|uniref:hypothetical protein n=1 Tax=Streptomyces sp. ME02-8801-2C TaxID=3028680 RepID=UPI0029AA4B3C|nr:hypothetical protein [Streptomyces sp. ME02-8801-2C]MDX3454417.1 hypothetical protein [Streptomyces sp. ME02-8801-2C]